MVSFQCADGPILTPQLQLADGPAAVLDPFLATAGWYPVAIAKLEMDIYILSTAAVDRPSRKAGVLDNCNTSAAAAVHV